ncbi:MAG: hypothetical protein ACI8TQ_002554 [Planctomycetota bacterium]|jgi:hypothetical protein
MDDLRDGTEHPIVDVLLPYGDAVSFRFPFDGSADEVKYALFDCLGSFYAPLDEREQFLAEGYGQAVLHA